MEENFVYKKRFSLDEFCDNDYHRMILKSGTYRSYFVFDAQS